MVLELDTGHASKEVEPRRGWPVRKLSLEEGGHEAMCQQGCCIVRFISVEIFELKDLLGWLSSQTSFSQFNIITRSFEIG